MVLVAAVAVVSGFVLPLMALSAMYLFHNLCLGLFHLIHGARRDAGRSISGDTG